MQTTVTARHCEIPEELKARAEALVAKLARIGDRAQRADVVFDMEHGRKVVELQLSLARGRTKVARGEADDFQTALDAAVQKLRGQLGKNDRADARRAMTR